MTEEIDETKGILVFDCIFCIYDDEGNEHLYRAPKIDFSHIAEYVEHKDLVPIRDFKIVKDE